MADDERSHEAADPEKVTELSRNTTYGEGETRDGAFIHADPNDGDEAFVALFFPFLLFYLRGRGDLPFELHPHSTSPFSLARSRPIVI
jgi:hypothetical protein